MTADGLKRSCRFDLRYGLKNTSDRLKFADAANRLCGGHTRQINIFERTLPVGPAKKLYRRSNGYQGMSADNVGALGEDIVAVLFGRKINGKFRFLPQRLGAKFELFDFIVQLLDETESPAGPYFFLQVKSTCEAGDVGSISAPFTASEVQSAINRRAPVYLVGVRIPDDNGLEDVYALAVDSTLSKGVSVVPRYFSLSKKEVRLEIFDEVMTNFAKSGFAFESNFTRASHAKAIASRKSK